MWRNRPTPAPTRRLGQVPGRVDAAGLELAARGPSRPPWPPSGRPTSTPRTARSQASGSVRSPATSSTPRDLEEPGVARRPDEGADAVAPGRRAARRCGCRACPVAPVTRSRRFRSASGHRVRIRRPCLDRARTIGRVVVAIVISRDHWWPEATAIDGRGSAGGVGPRVGKNFKEGRERCRSR